jgi:hypothetical protein
MKQLLHIINFCLLSFFGYFLFLNINEDSTFIISVGTGYIVGYALSFEFHNIIYLFDKKRTFF